MGASEAMMSAWCSGTAAMTSYWMARAWSTLHLTEPEVVSLVVATGLLEHARRLDRGLDSIHPTDPSCG